MMNRNKQYSPIDFNFNPSEHKKTETMPDKDKKNFIDLEEGGFVQKEALDTLVNAEEEAKIVSEQTGREVTANEILYNEAASDPFLKREVAAAFADAFNKGRGAKASATKPNLDQQDRTRDKAKDSNSSYYQGAYGKFEDDNE